MTKKMLIDAAHPEETRVVIVSGTRLEDFDVEVASRRILRGNIYLAKVTRVEPSLQAAFVDYGGNRHGFLAFNEIHPDYYQIPVEDRQALIAEDAAQSTAERAARPEGPTIERVSADENSVEEPPAEGSSSEEPPVEGAPSEEPPVEASPIEMQPAEDIPGASFEPAPAAEAAGLAPETPPEGAAEDAGAPPPEGGEPKPIPVEVLGGDSDDDLEVRRPSPARRRRHYKIQEVIKRRQILLVQVVKEERGTKGAALTTYLSLAGRYCVLMPNTARGGGISRKISGGSDRQRLKSVVDKLDIPDGMAVIVRTAGAERSESEIQRDFEYLMRTWAEVRERTLESIAPALVYEEGSIIKRAIRDLYTNNIDEVIVAGEDGYRQARELMKLLEPGHVNRVQLYADPAVALLRRHQVEDQLATIHSPQVQLRSGGYIVINQTEALVSIDVNSGRATRERHIEETALRTNLEAADEIARQLRLRDLAGLIVIDFIDMESNRNQAQVERRLKEAMRHDRARIQIGRISHFGLLEMSRQRLRPSLIETSSVPCPYCGGTGIRRATDTSALAILRAIEDEGARGRAEEIVVHAATPIVLFILNQKRAALSELERRFAFRIVLAADDTLVPPAHRIDRTKARTGPPVVRAPAPAPEDESELEAESAADIAAPEIAAAEPAEAHAGEFAGEAREGRRREGESPRDYQEDAPLSGRRRRRRRGRRGRGRAGESPRATYEAPLSERAGEPAYPLAAPQPESFPSDIGGAPRPEPYAGAAERESEAVETGGESGPGAHPDVHGEGHGKGPGEGQPHEGRRRRRRGRRGGRGRRRHGEAGDVAPHEATGGERIGGERMGGEPRGAERRPAAPERREFKVTTPAEAGIAFLDGPRFGRYEAEPEEAPPPRAEARPEPRAEAKPEPAPKAEPPAPAREETPEERERRLRASKTEIVEVGKAEGAPAKRGWWRRG
jgi:ribonuclease E